MWLYHLPPPQKKAGMWCIVCSFVRFHCNVSQLLPFSLIVHENMKNECLGKVYMYRSPRPRQPRPVLVAQFPWLYFLCSWINIFQASLHKHKIRTDRLPYVYNKEMGCGFSGLEVRMCYFVHVADTFWSFLGDTFFSGSALLRYTIDRFHLIIDFSTIYTFYFNLISFNICMGILWHILVLHSPHMYCIHIQGKWNCFPLTRSILPVILNSSKTGELSAYLLSWSLHYLLKFALGF